MQIVQMQCTTVLKLQAASEDRSLEVGAGESTGIDGAGLFDHGHDLVPDLLRRHDWQPRQHHEVVNVGRPRLRPMPPAAGRRDSRVVNVGRSFEQTVERHQPAAATACSLAVDLLQADYICITTLELRPQDAETIVQ